MAVHMLTSVSTAGTSKTAEIDESGNDVSSCLEKINKLDVGFITQQEQFEQKLVVQKDGGEKISSGTTTAGLMTENNLEKFTLLYDKYNTQCSELERLEKVNGELEEQLQKVRREYDSTQEILNSCRSEFCAHRQGLERRVVDVELQLKMTTQRAEAREQHYQQRIKQNDAKWDQKFVQLLKKIEAVEKEKNDAVCRYAAREAQLIRLQAQIDGLEVQNNMLSVEKNTLQKSTQFEYLQNMKHSLTEVERQLSLEKKVGKEREEQHRMTVKHLEASQTVLTEFRSRLESIQSQLALEQMEKEECQEKLRKSQAMLKTLEQQCAEEMDAAIKKTNNQEELYNNVCVELASLRSRNSTLSQQLDHAKQANAQLQVESQQLSEELIQARQTHRIALEKLESLEEVQALFNSNLRRVKLAEIATIDAAAERDQAEAEAAQCRKQAERMLEITEQLADKNSSLTSQQEMFRCKNLELSQRVKTLESSLSSSERRVVELERELELLKVDSSAEIGTLRQQIDTNIAKEQKLNAVINELRNEQKVLKKKNSSSLKELRAEVQHLRKLQSRSPNSFPPNAPPVENNLSLNVLPSGAMGLSTSSRTSSIASSTDIFPLAIDCTSTSISRIAAHREESQQFIISLSSDEANHMQQQMIEKIVKLQRQLARRQDKIEFLEEHVRQCTQELLKKTKIIQNFALREEASLLLPEGDLNKITRGPNGSSSSSSSFSLIGNLFTSTANGVTGKSELKFATEVNSRLQAVLEDALHKNITLKNNIDTLGEEISRLSRENRQLSLSKII
uniref:BMA-CCCP-1 n=1 Tax=Brugia malayi TaxID=6279 RepID=A0A0H5SQW1_BRUMA|nr:BMA-CCCP-1 [Brugia malayi]